MLPCQRTPDRNIQLGVLTNQAVKDEKENGECNGVETLPGGVATDCSLTRICHVTTSTYSTLTVLTGI
jgi:hypothetical protein